MSPTAFPSLSGTSTVRICGMTGTSIFNLLHWYSTATRTQTKRAEARVRCGHADKTTMALLVTWLAWQS
jgi:hypothetical protein